MPTIRSKDGALISAELHRPEGAPARAAVIVLHGFGEHLGSYRPLAERLARGGYASVLFDQRGHGDLPRGQLGTLTGEGSFLDDVDAVIAAAKREWPDLPLVLYGHSMGGNIAANYLLRRGASQFSCAALESPWLGLFRGEPLLGRIVNALSYILPDMPLPRSKTKLPPELVNGEPATRKETAADPLYHNRLSTRMFRVLNHGCAYALKNAPRLSLPLFLAVAKNERIVSNDAISRFYSRCKSVAERHDYNSNHQIHNDVEREQFFGDLIEFLDKHCPAR